MHAHIRWDLWSNMLGEGCTPCSLLFLSQSNLLSHCNLHLVSLLPIFHSSSPCLSPSFSYSLYLSPSACFSWLGACFLSSLLCVGIICPCQSHSLQPRFHPHLPSFTIDDKQAAVYPWTPLHQLRCIEDILWLCIRKDLVEEKLPAPEQARGEAGDWNNQRRPRKI